MKQKPCKFHLPFTKRAESLIETIVAISVLAIGATATAILVRTSILGNELSQDRMFALSLAQEGIEGVRSIRDTNWLRYSSNKDGCWNTMPGAGVDITNCDSSPIDEDDYELHLDLTNDVLSYYLVGGSAPLFVADYQIWECPIENFDASDTGVLYANPDDTTGCTAIDFYRKVTIEYQAADLMSVTSEVGWYTEGNEKTVTLTEDISNW